MPPASEHPAKAAPVYAVRGSTAFLKISFALFLAGFSTFSLLYCIQPLLPLFARDFGVSPAQSSLALSMTTGLLAIAVVAAAALAEGFERRSLMFVSMASAAVLTIVQTFIPHWPSFLLVRALEGVVLGGVPAVALAYLAEEIDPKGLGFSLGLYVSGNAIGGMVGRLGTSALAEAFNWRVALGVMGLIDLVTAIGFFLLLPRSRNFTPQHDAGFRFHWLAWKGHLFRPGLQRLFLMGFMGMGAFVSVYNYAGFRLSAAPYFLNQTQIGLIFTVYVVGVVSSYLAGGLADRIGRRPVQTIGLLAMGAGLAITLAQPLWLVIAGVAIFTGGFFATQPVLNSWVGRIAPSTKGHAAALYLLAYYAGSSVMGSVSGHAYSAGGWPGLCLMVAVLIAIALAATWSLHPGINGEAGS